MYLGYISTHHQVALDLLVDLVKGSISVHHVDLSLFMFFGPGIVFLWADVFVTQAQRAQSLIGEGLKHKNN